MEELAPADTVRITGQTAKLVEGAVEIRTLGQIRIKGLPTAIEVFELPGTIPNPGPFRAVRPRRLSPFTGRSGEIAQLRQAMIPAEAGLGQFPMIIAEPRVA